MSEKINRQAMLMGVGGPWEMKESPIPHPGPGQIVVKMLSASICNQTDLNAVKGYHPPHDHQFMGMLPHDYRVYRGLDKDNLAKNYPPRPYPNTIFPTLMGHEGMGEVYEVGPALPSIFGEQPTFKKGDRVVVFGLLGGLGEYVLAQNDLCAKVPDNVSNEHAGLTEPLGILYAATRKSVFLGESVAILGGGALGLSGVQYAKLRGASTIIVTEPSEYKRELALKFGATHVIDPTQQNVVAEIDRITNGQGTDTVLECAGVEETIQQSMYAVKRGGIIIIVGAGSKPVLVDIDYIHFKQLRVEGIHYGMKGSATSNMTELLNVMASGVLDIDSLITHRYKFSIENVREAFEEIEKGNVIKAVFSFD